jgi:hypothetical protein
MVKMADYPEGYDFSKEQAVFMIASTQVRVALLMVRVCELDAAAIIVCADLLASKRQVSTRGDIRLLTSCCTASG